jgi:hypothetical protein
MDDNALLAELSAPTTASTTQSPVGSGASDVQDMDVVLVRPTESEATSAGGSFDIGDLIADGMEELSAQRKTGFEPSQTPPNGGGQSFKIDTMTAAAAAVFYTDVILPGAVGAIGELFAGEGYKYKSLGKRFEQSYRDTVTRLLESGEITLPTPMQCFVAMTLVIIAANAVQVFKERKKRTKKTEAQKQREYIDESAPVQIDTPSASGPIRSDLSVEIAKRKKFQTENGFYSYDLEGVYIKKGERRFGPSIAAENAIKRTSDNAEIKEILKKSAK